ncbi:MAG: internalization-related competence protein ComEC/Rec2 [Edaphobacter sp.]|nr:internalization-related competence protein ComEC/Rec2 [Edaphobacter sp.]
MQLAGSSKPGGLGRPNPELWAKARVEGLALRRAPLLTAVCWFALGVVMARSWQPAVVLLAALVVLAGLTVVGLRLSLRIAVVPLAAVWMVVGFWCAEVQPAPSTQQALLGYADGLSRQVRGRVVRVRALPPRAKAADQDNDPAWWMEKEPEAAEAVSVDVQVEEVEEVTPDVSRMMPVSGGVRVTLIAGGGAHDLAGALPELRCGDVVEAPMRLRVPERYRDPGAWQYADYLLAQGIGTHANVRAGKLTQLGEGAASVQCRLYAAQSWAAGRMSRYVRSGANRFLPKVMRLSEDDAGMLNAMLFGDRAGLNHGLRVGFERTGSFHLFVVSGMHVGLLAGLVFWMARRVKLREWQATLLTIALTAGYALLTGFGAPVQRALFMTIVFLLARLLSRDRSVLNALGAAALGVLVWSPGALFEASFQMTFLAIVAIGGIAVPLGERSFLPYARAAKHLEDAWEDAGMPPRVAQMRVMLRVWGEGFAGALGGWAYGLPATVVRWGLLAVELALIGLVAELVMVLPMAMYFHRATMFALPANMLSVPLVAVLAPMAVVTFCAALVSSWLAILPGAATAMLLHGITGVIGRVSAVRMADLRVPGPVWWVALAAVAGWAFCIWAVRRSRGWAWVTVAVLPLIAVMVLWPERMMRSPGMMEVTAIDVGQGDSLLVVGPEGRTMLVDAGGPVGGVTESAEATSRFDVGEEVVSPYLWSRRIRRLDVIALSHAHSDHMGGMAAVMRNFRPRELWVGIDPDSEAYRALLAEAGELDVMVRHLHAGDDVAWGEAKVKVLAPEAGYVNAGLPSNNDSLVMRVEYGRASVLLEGDAEAPSERAMLASGRMTPVTLLKVGHHGSRTSTTAEFFAAAAPKDALVSVGKGNTFGHPRFEVVKRMAEAQTRLYRTDEFGLTTFLMGRRGGIREVVGAESLMTEPVE